MIFEPRLGLTTAGRGCLPHVCGVSRCFLRISSTGLLHAQQCFAQLEQIHQRAGNVQSLTILSKSSISYFGKAKHAFEDQERMFDTRPRLRLDAIAPLLNAVDSAGCGDCLSVSLDHKIAELDGHLARMSLFQVNTGTRERGNRKWHSFAGNGKSRFWN